MSIWETRMERGMRILQQASKITENPDGTLNVPSQTRVENNYRVDIARDACTCPDYVHRRVTCKHIHAASLWMLTRGTAGGAQRQLSESGVPNEHIRCPCCQTLIALEVEANRVVNLRPLSGS